MTFKLVLSLADDNVVRATLKGATARINNNPNPADLKGQIELESAYRVRDIALAEAYTRKLRF